ncbi:uncharacterized protein BJ212DRAFT_1482862 [Suillus subaureus]|uniref:Uncharacterized protein n=1 Tax=Suillus subaureus TaxID=48587 RepID=A0A9P7E761_9AGAM|nr:uncharacterized protein BJ212DRAFT_1482862 [Suillus subaureus]KAG1812794.1 hypothetical protein BJ212DRAFT_1482862 [Suillus subaureus]
MPTALTLFKANTALSDNWLQSFDACAVAVQGNLVIMTPNMHFIPEFHHFDAEILQACTDGCFGVIDCFQWPQAYDNTFCHAACIPQKEAFPSPHPLHWAWFTPTWNDLESIPGNLFPVGTLVLDKVDGLQTPFKLAEQQLCEYRQAQPDRGQVIYGRLLSLCHTVAHLKSHPLTFCDLLIFVTNAQHLFLDIYSYIDRVLIAQPLTTSGLCHVVWGDWMGAFVQSSDVCKKLFCTGIPIWYVRTSAYIPLNMKVIEPVLLTHLDHIIIGMYTEGSKVHPFKVIYCSPGGHHHHVHVHCLYAGTTHLDPKADNPQPSSSSNSGPKPKHQPYSIEARPACPAQSGESRDKWQDPDTPYLLLPNLHWEAAMKIAIKDQSHIHTPYIIDQGYRFLEPALLIGPKLPECLQTYLANWLASRALWVGHVNHNPPCTYPTPQLWCDFLGSVPSAQPQSHKADRKGLMATKKWKQVMWELFGDDFLESQGDVFLPDGVVEFQGEEISVSSLTNPSALLAQKVTWELFELGFQYELWDLDRHLAQREWKDDPAGHEQLLHGVFLGDAGLVMWSEPFLSEHYRLWDNTLKGCLPYMENFRQLLCDWDGVPPLLMTLLTSDNFTDTKSWEVKPPIVPHSLSMQS